MTTPWYEGPVSFSLSLFLYQRLPHLFGLVLLGLRKLLRCRVRYDVLHLWTHSTVSNSLSFSPWHSLSFPVFYTSSLSPGLACHRSSCFPLHHYSASFCFRLSRDSLLALVSFCPAMNLLHFLPLSTIIPPVVAGWMKVFEGGGWCQGGSICWCPALCARPFTTGGHNCLAWCDWYQKSYI